jgi:putative flippase GtrA
MPTQALTTVTISAIAGILLSLLFSYVPHLKDWFDEQTGTTKRLIMLASLVAAAAGALALNCGTIAGHPILPGASLCTETTIVDAVSAFIAALVANQSAYQLAPAKP